MSIGTASYLLRVVEFVTRNGPPFLGEARCVWITLTAASAVVSSTPGDPTCGGIEVHIMSRRCFLGAAGSSGVARVISMAPLSPLSRHPAVMPGNRNLWRFAQGAKKTAWWAVLLGDERATTSFRWSAIWNWVVVGSSRLTRTSGGRAGGRVGRISQSRVLLLEYVIHVRSIEMTGWGRVREITTSYVTGRSGADGADALHTAVCLSLRYCRL